MWKHRRLAKQKSSIFFPCASPKTTHWGLQLYTVINIWPWSYTWKKFATTEINNLPLSKKNKYKDTHRKLESLHLFLHQNKCFSCKLNASGNSSNFPLRMEFLRRSKGLNVHISEAFFITFSEGAPMKAPENTIRNVLTLNAFTNPALASLDD